MSQKIDKAINEELAVLKKERSALLKSVEGLEAERVKLEKQMQDADTKFREKVKEIRAITHPRLFDLDMEIASLTRKLSTNVNNRIANS